MSSDRECPPFYSSSTLDNTSEDDPHDPKTTNKDLHDKEQLNALRLSRKTITAFCHTSFFGELVKDAFVKIVIGSNNNENVYRVCEVVDVVESSDRYELGDTRVDQKLVVRLGKSQRSFRMNLVSDRQFVTPEYHDWLLRMIKHREPLPNPRSVDEKISFLKKTIKSELSGVELYRISCERSRLDKCPGNLTIAQEHVSRQLKVAKYNKDEKMVQKLEARYEELEKLIDQKYSHIDRIVDKNTQQVVDSMKGRNEYLAKLSSTEKILIPPIFKQKYGGIRGDGEWGETEIEDAGIPQNENDEQTKLKYSNTNEDIDLEADNKTLITSGNRPVGDNLDARGKSRKRTANEAELINAKAQISPPFLKSKSIFDYKGISPEQ
ncbi:hypothetical protein ACOME3_000019 [Neoechinorhynchus agilis]